MQSAEIEQAASWERYVIQQAQTLLNLTDDEAGDVCAANSANEEWLLIFPGRAAYVMQIGSDDDGFEFYLTNGTGPDCLRFPFPDDIE